MPYVTGSSVGVHNEACEAACKPAAYRAREVARYSLGSRGIGHCHGPVRSANYQVQRQRAMEPLVVK